MEKLIKRLEQMVEVKSFTKKREDLYFLTVREEQIILLLAYLKENEGFSHLAFLQAVDYIENNKFMLTYMLYNLDKKNT
jgi:NADH-quinone oxidoreductase subunit C